jgi:hypothetical protein
MLDKEYYLCVDLDPDMLKELLREYRSQGPVDIAKLDVCDPGFVSDGHATTTCTALGEASKQSRAVLPGGCATSLDSRKRTHLKGLHGLS